MHTRHLPPELFEHGLVGSHKALQLCLIYVVGFVKALLDSFRSLEDIYIIVDVHALRLLLQVITIT